MRYNDNRNDMWTFDSTLIGIFRDVINSDGELTMRFSPNDESPEPLMKYLIENYGFASGKNFDHDYGPDNFYWFHKERGLGIEFLTEYVENNDKTLQMSWPQITAFVRGHWDEIFSPDTDENPPVTIGDFVDASKLGAELTFDEIVAMEGDIIAIDKNNLVEERYQVVYIASIVNSITGERTLVYKNGSWKPQRIGEYSFSGNSDSRFRAWKINSPSHLDIVRRHYPQISDSKLGYFMTECCVGDFFRYDCECYECSDCWKLASFSKYTGFKEKDVAFDADKYADGKDTVSAE